MTEPDFEAAKLRVYEEFGIWKPGQRCDKGKEKERYPWMCEHMVAWGDHDIPPPELTDAVAWQVLQAAVHWQFSNKRSIPFDDIFDSIDTAPDSKRALIVELDAALAGAGQGAHEA